MAIAYRLLGALEADRDGDRVRLGGGLQQALLALLAAAGGDTVPAGRLIEDLWDERPPETALNVLQGCVSDLRKALGADAIITRGGGYAIDAARASVDIDEFERLVRSAGATADAGRPQAAAAELEAALTLWRGEPLAGLREFRGVGLLAVRLEERRLTVLLRRMESELAAGHHADVIHELRDVVARNPLHEGACAQLMVALYREGRQVDALEAFATIRTRLVDELGVDPGRALREVQRAILRQDPALDLPAAATDVPPLRASRGCVLAVSLTPGWSIAMAGVAGVLCRSAGRELVVARIVTDAGQLADETSLLAALREQLLADGVAARVAAFTSTSPAEEVVRLATEHGVDVVLATVDRSLVAATGVCDPVLAAILAGVSGDVGLVIPGGDGSGALAEGPIVTPFGAGDHDWTAIELAAAIAYGSGAPLILVGTESDPDLGRRDASRLLAQASLLVQNVAGIVAVPRLVPPGAEGVLAAAKGAALLVVGLSERWLDEGLGAAREQLVRHSPVPLLLVRRGERSQALRPDRTLTRFAWSVEAPVRAGGEG